MSDERPESLAAQAAAWVPPWERASRAPDAAYAAEQRALAEADADEPDDLADPEAGAADESPHAPAGESPHASAEVPDELPPVPGEGDGPVIVDTPLEVEGEPELAPTDVGVGPEVPLPGAIEEAAEREDTPSTVVDAPLPPDGDDAGDVFDQAADDDVSDEAEVDLPFVEEVPGPEADDEDSAADDSAEAATASADASSSSATSEPPVAEVRAAESPAAESPAAESPAAESPAAESPAAESPAAESPAAESPAAESPAAESPAAESPAVSAATAEEIDFAGIVAETDAQDLLTAQGGEEVEVTAEAAKPSSGVPAQSRRRKKPAESDGVQGALDVRTDEGVEVVDLKPLDDQEMRAALEAIMLVVDEPVAEMQLAQVLEQPTERVAAMLEDISARYTAAGHGFDLRRVAGGWRLYTRPEYAPYVERFVLDGQSVRLTQAALETLAVVAYKQPVTRSRISAIRGVNCDGVMRTLVTRGLIEECGTESETGAHLYRTTGLFLEKLGLNSVGQLPPLAPFLPDDVEEVLDASG